jgi:ABC-2 family transporter protein
VTWLVWRQHRQQALAAAVGLLAVALFLVPSGRQMHAAFDELGLEACLRTAGDAELIPADGGCKQLSEQFSGRFQGVALASLLLLFLPALAGLFWGAPLVARELEHGTHRLVWTQGVTRLRWATVKLGLVGAGVVLVAVAYALLVGWWIAPLNDATGYRFTWLFFDQQGPVLVAYALFAVALGVLAGTLTRKVLPAMAVTLGGYLATRVLVALMVRPRFLPQRRRTYPVVADTPTESNPLTGDWVITRASTAPRGSSSPQAAAPRRSATPPPPPGARPSTARAPTTRTCSSRRTGSGSSRASRPPCSSPWPPCWCWPPSTWSGAGWPEPGSSRRAGRASEAPSTRSVPAGDEGDTGGRQDDLDEQLDPVDPARASDAHGVGEQRPDEGGDDADDDRQPDGNGLPAWKHQPAERPDDQADDDGADDAGDRHRVLLLSLEVSPTGQATPVPPMPQ